MISVLPFSCHLHRALCIALVAPHVVYKNVCVMNEIHKAIDELHTKSCQYMTCITGCRCSGATVVVLYSN